MRTLIVRYAPSLLRTRAVLFAGSATAATAALLVVGSFPSVRSLRAAWHVARAHLDGNDVQPDAVSARDTLTLPAL